MGTNRHHHHLLLLLLLLLLFVLSAPLLQATAPPNALLAPIHLDATTSLYTLTLAPPSPSGSSPLMLDLDNSNLWRDCINPRPYSSPTFTPVLCNDTTSCAAAQACTSLICGSAGCYDTCNGLPFPACSNYTCVSWASISAIQSTMSTSVWRDTIALPSTDGRRVLNKITIPDFEFLCADDTLLNGGQGNLPPGVVGGAGLSRAAIALPSQISAKIPTISRKFAYCLPSVSAAGPGVIFFGDGPYVFQPGNIDVSTLLRYTPILSFSKQSDSYFLQVNSIAVNSVALGINASLLTIHRDKSSRTYEGGTRFSSSVPYTRLHPSIYSALASAFKKAAIARGIKPVAAVTPFDLCFDASTASATRVGYDVPQIDIALKGKGRSKSELWQMFGANSVVKVNDGIFCLAFQRTDEYESRAIIVGTYQQQNAFFQFDLAANRLGFIPTLLGMQTTCSNFNLT